MKKGITPERLAQVNSFEELAVLFYDELGWPKDTWPTFEGVKDLYGIEPGANVQSVRVVQQLSADQSWGIFLVDFGDHELRRSGLRAILNQVATKERQNHSERTWAHENILFICRSQHSKWTLGHYTGEKPATAKLKTVGWDDPLSARTFCTRNLPWLRWSDQTSWQRAWDAEALTKDFYKEYRRVFETFEAAVHHPSKKKEDKRLFVQSLFNRLMFLAFIEKMGWLSLDGNKDYLRTLYVKHLRSPHADTETFYDVLQLLFFSGLNSINGVGGGDKLLPILGKVPYLNGGLFQRDEMTEPTGIKIPDRVFGEIFEEPNGLFRRYTFTVTESTPLDVDVAVDPEMLGKIFEELVTGRHESGSYYTPRSVVSFMCREALKGYVTEHGIDSQKAASLVDDHRADDLLHGEISSLLTLFGRIKVVDPACGSGAYLLGMMRELFDLIQILERRRVEASPRELYDVKLDIIQNNLYGVDIDPFAVNIARLRLWLSLAVDHKGGNPEPLPNLDYKIEAGDSLIAPNPTESPAQMDIFRESAIQEFKDLKREYGVPPRTQTDAQKKVQIKMKIDKIRADMRSWYGAGSASKTGAFDWRIEFADVFSERHDEATLGGRLNLGLEAGQRGQGELAAIPEPGGFDVVLANPPYVRADAQFAHLLPDKAAQQAEIAKWKAYREELKRSKIYETLHEKWDLYIPFLERAFQILRPKGQMVFIIPDAYNGNKYAGKSHEYFLERSQVERIDFCSDIALFTAGVYNTILRFSKQPPASGHITIRVRRWGDQHEHFTHNMEVLSGASQLSLNARVFRNSPEAASYAKGGITIPLSHVCYISKGAVLHSSESLAPGAFKLEDLVSETYSDIHNKRYFQGKHMGTWTIENHLWLEYGTARAPALFSRKTFPELYDVPEKLVTMDLSGPSLRVVYDDQQMWHNHSAWSIVPWHSLSEVQNKSLNKTARYSSERQGPTAITAHREQLELISSRFDILYLLGLMNSTVAKNWIASNRRNKMHVYPDDWKPFPIRDISLAQQQPIVDLVRQILFRKKADPSADVDHLEAQLNARVKFLYFDQVGDETYDEWKARLEAEKGTEVEDVRNLAKAGESDTVEFKSSVIWDVMQNKHSLVMRDEVLKEICAFLNADGGTILCGVGDNGEFLGLDRDIKHASNPDKLGLVITNALGDLLTPHPAELVKLKFIEVDQKTILKIDVEADATSRYESPSVKKEDQGKNLKRTHVRIHSSAKALEGQDLINWWGRRSSKSM